MRIAVLSRNENLYSTRRLVEACESRDHTVRVLNHLHCYMDIASNDPSVHYQGHELERFDAVIPRIGARVTFYGTAVLRQFEMMGAYAVNDSNAIARSRDKLRCLQLLSRAGLGLPLTGFANSPDNTRDLINVVGGAPLVVKLLESTQGKGVVLAETYKAAESLIETFRGLNANFLVQQYVKEAGGADLRCLVVGNRVVAAMKRQAQPGEFRSNLHRGGTATVVKLSPKERATAVKAARVVGLNVAGVDLLQAEEGPMVLEVNSSPGLEGIEKATGKDVAGMVVEFIEKNATRRRSPARG